MPNQNYAQVATLFTQGKLSWATDSILALLHTNEVFDANATTVNDLVGQRQASQPINGRWFSDGLAMGLPVAFPKVSQATAFQIVVVQDTGNNSPNLLAFIDVNADSAPITVQRSGTLIVRPVLPPIEVPAERPPTIGVWMRLPA